jgi:hypothetical protein
MVHDQRCLVGNKDDALTNSWTAGTDGNGETLCHHDLPLVWTQQHEITGRAARIPGTIWWCYGACRPLPRRKNASAGNRDDTTPRIYGQLWKGPLWDAKG